MKKTAVLGAFLAVAAAAPAIVAPQLSAPAQAQERAEYPDVPRGHWAYEALDKLSRAGIIEGRPGGVYQGNQAMTRYEFAVAIARLLDRMGNVDLTEINRRLDELAARPVGGGTTVDLTPYITRAEVNDLIAALRTEFRTELERLGVRVDALEGRVSNLENRVALPPRVTFTPSLLHRMAFTNYINNRYGGGGRAVYNGPSVINPATLPNDGLASRDGRSSYTDFELRLTDRITDRLTLNAAGRSITGTQEDPWLPYNGTLREANVVAQLGRSNGLTLIAGRQRTKFGQGLLYDNDFIPTDQLHAQFNVGPVQINSFIGTTNNNHSYLAGGAGFYQRSDFANFALRQDDPEWAVRAGFNLFRIAGNPVQVGITRLGNGVAEQKGDSVDLTIPLFNRTVGLEWVRQRQYANWTKPSGSPKAFNVTVPVLRARALDLNFAYGKADDDFQFFMASAANPFARTYSEALFDRPMALGAPLIGPAGASAAATKVWDVTGTLRLIRRLPLDLRYYSAKGRDGIKLGNVWSVGSTFNLTPGFDLEVKYGQYDSKYTDTLKYFRVGANVGF